MKTVNKEDLITIAVGDLFTACYDAVIASNNTVTHGNEHADAHYIADDIIDKVVKL